jgi:hypothetical protein
LCGGTVVSADTLGLGGSGCGGRRCLGCHMLFALQSKELVDAPVAAGAEQRSSLLAQSRRGDEERSRGEVTSRGDEQR